MKNILYNLILLVGVSLFLASPVFAHQETVTIFLTDDGFVPKSVSAHVGSRISFLNKGSDPGWPASDFHPTHMLYPEFDARRPIRPGDFWGFKAEEVGKWEFHDHLDPHKKGTLVIKKDEEVEEVKLENKKSNWILDFWNYLQGLVRKPVTPLEFKKLSSEKQFNELTNMAKQKGAKEVWLFVIKTYQSEAGNSGNIHDLAHLAGGLLFQKKGWEGLVDCTPKFAFGCYHGFFDVAFAKNLSGLSKAHDKCLLVGAVNSGPFGSCIHGIGHGVASYYHTTDLTSSLTTCQKLKNGSQFCFDGVFMEFERGATADFYKKDDLLYPCDTVSQEFVFSCGRNLPAVVMDRLGRSFEEAAAVCLGSGNEGLTQGCLDSLGYIAAARGKGKATEIITWCAKIPDDNYRVNCLTKAAGELVFSESPNWQNEYPKLCEGMALCESYVQGIIRDYGRKMKTQLPEFNQGDDPKSYVATLMKACSRGGAFNECYEQVGEQLSKNFDLKKSLAILKEDEEVSEVYARCHEVTHYLSRNEYKKTGSIPKVYAACDSTCHGGCYHGALEEYLRQNREARLENICGKRESYDRPLVYFECVHGLGHAAMFVTDMEVRQSLKMCDNLPDQGDRERCYSGVFMENASSSTNLEHPTEYLSKTDPMFPCTILAEKYLSLCYRYQSSYFAILSSYDWNKVIDLCFQAPNQYQHECFRTMGTNQVGYTSDPELWKKDCDLIPRNEFRGVCHTGVVSSLAYRFVGDTEKMLDYCLRMDDEIQKGCYEQIGLGFVEWFASKSRAEKSCQEIANVPGRNWCHSGIAKYGVVG